MLIRLATINVFEGEKDEVILIRLAERLHNMRTIEFLDDRRKPVKAKETRELFIIQPLKQIHYLQS